MQVALNVKKLRPEQRLRYLVLNLVCFFAVVSIKAPQDTVVLRGQS